MTKRKQPEIPEDMETASLMEYFTTIDDPRVERSKLHPLASVLALCLCAVVSGADSFVGIEAYGNAREAWLRNFLDLPNGIPSHDTLGRIFGMLNPRALEKAFRDWVAAVTQLTKGEVVAIDGKTLRRSFRKAGNSAFVHMVSAWAAGNRMVLGQIKTDEKSNEINAIPRLLELLQLKGCLVTIDAMGCQKEIARKIVDGTASYMLAVKDNQPTLAAAVEAAFDTALAEPAFAKSGHETIDKGHGRIERRRCWTLDVDASCGSPFDQWPGLSGIVRVESQRTLGEKTSLEHRHYITSACLTPAEALAASRSHWGIENQLHWVLDVAFREDDCRIRVGYAGENFAVLRHFAVNLIRSQPSPSKKHPQAGVKVRRMIAACSDQYLLRLFGIDT